MLGQKIIVILIGLSQRQSVEQISEITVGFEPVGLGGFDQAKARKGRNIAETWEKSARSLSVFPRNAKFTRWYDVSNLKTRGHLAKFIMVFFFGFFNPQKPCI